MTRWLKYTFAILAAILTASGGAYLWMKYLLTTDDPFAVVNHPWQPAMLHIHVLAAPAFLVVFGILFNAHVAGRVGKPIPNRISGLVSLAAVAIMTASGYCLQVFTDARAWQICFVAHLASAGVFAIAYVMHLTIGVKILADDRQSPRRSAA
jgi:hypothetical protein